MIGFRRARASSLLRTGPDSTSGGFGMLTGDDSGRRAGDFLRHREIKPDAGEGFVETSLVNLCCIANALDTRDQLVARAKGEIVVQVFVAVDVDLGRELAIAGG